MDNVKIEISGRANLSDSKKKEIEEYYSKIAHNKELRNDYFKAYVKDLQILKKLRNDK